MAAKFGNKCKKACPGCAMIIIININNKYRQVQVALSLSASSSTIKLSIIFAMIINIMIVQEVQ